MPDECDPDCNANGVPDACDLDCGTGNCNIHPLGCGASQDCNENGMPGLVDLGATREFSDQTANLIDNEIKQIMDQAYQEIKEILEKHPDQMEAMKNALMKYETLDGEEVKQIIDGKKLDKPTVGDLLAAEQQRQTEQKPADQTKPKKSPAPDEGLTGPMPQPGLG